MAKKNASAARREKKEGHAAHTKDADGPLGLPGAMPRPIKITMIGAGSNFTPRLLSDVLQIPHADRGHVALVDIDRTRLQTMHRLIKKVIAVNDRPGWTVSASTKRREVMGGSDYLVNCIEVSGVECVRHDNDIPKEYGVDQCIGDTIGPGGLFKALRTVPVWLDVLRDAEELCPDALVLNYTNPMSILCLAAGRTSSMRIVGLCHSVQGTSHLLARRAGVPYDEMAWECAGINHLAWFTKLEQKGRDLYPRLMRKAKRDLAAGRATEEGDSDDLVRKDMMLNFGAFITESSGHLSEYLPYYRIRGRDKKKYLRKRYEGGSSFYADNWPTWRKNADKNRMDMVTGKAPIEWKRSWEYASWIVEAREKNVPHRIHGNVMNAAGGAGPLVANLPGDGCVEIAVMVDGNGYNPARFGRLPAQMAAICDSNMRMYDLAATACIERSKEAAIHALMLDPLTAACCAPADIRKMAEAMFKAEKKFLKGYK